MLGMLQTGYKDLVNRNNNGQFSRHDAFFQKQYSNPYFEHGLHEIHSRDTN